MRKEKIKIEEELRLIKNWIREVDLKLNNHLTDVQDKLSTIVVDVAWLKKFIWTLIGIILSAVIAFLFK